MERSISRRKIHEQLADILKEDIISGVYSVGEDLPSEREIMARFGVGRPAVREALSKLALIGLINIRPGMRSQVRKPNIDRLLGEMTGSVNALLSTINGIRQFQELRLILESGLVRKISRTATHEDIKTLTDILDLQEENFNNYDTFAQIDVQFHNAFANMTGNQLLITLSTAMGKWLVEQRTTTLQCTAQLEKTLFYHKKILDAVKNHDPDMAEKYMIEHIEQVNEVWHNVKGNNPIK